MSVPANRVFVDEKYWIHGILQECQEGLVSIYVNDQQITRVPVVMPRSGEGGEFIFRPGHSLCQAMPAEYALSVELPDGTNLVLDGNAAIGKGDGSLQDKLTSGYIVSAKAGYLFKPLEEQPEYKRDIFQSYKKARELFSDIEGVTDLYVAYGSLLGLVRDGNFIAHDDDFDVGFMVEAETPGDAAQHFHRVVALLREKGADVFFDMHLGNFHIRFAGLPDIDVFLMYYRESVQELCAYNLAFGCNKSVILPLKEVEFQGNIVLIPNKASELLAETYGDGWAVPDPYFQWHMTAKHDQLKHAYSEASIAVEKGLPLPEFHETR